jgi:hypothetical protein
MRFCPICGVKVSVQSKSGKCHKHADHRHHKADVRNVSKFYIYQKGCFALNEK